MRAALARPFRRFARAQGGAISVETVIMVPVLIATLVGMTAIWDGFRHRNAGLKAAVTVSDAISRETSPIDTAYIDRMDALFAFLAGARGDSSLRVSVVANTLTVDGMGEELALRWSASSDPGLPAVSAAADLAAHIPEMAVGDQVIVVESWLDWTPPATSQVVGRTFQEVTVARARFVPQVLWRD